jgi:dTDP-4-amino-4,6-dideoxygalactose transaminase
VVHYAGVACEMDTIMNIAKKHDLMVIEDAAQGVMSTYKGKALGTIGDFGCFSFHETKNYSMGEGGAEMFESMLKEMPIGNLPSFGIIGMDQVKALIDKLNEQA